MKSLLDNIIWHSLTGHQRELALGAGGARRYLPGFSPIAGFADPEQPQLDDLAAAVQPGEHLYCERWAGRPPSGWRVEEERLMRKLVWEAPPPPGTPAADAMPLGPEHAEQAVALAELTRPGPFGRRTIEMGEYYGYFSDGELIAMAGERMHAGNLREISGVCTHPDHLGRGHARALMLKLVQRELGRGQIPFLHVMSHNLRALTLYRRMGFVDYREVVVRVIART